MNKEHQNIPIRDYLAKKEIVLNYRKVPPKSSSLPGLLGSLKSSQKGKILQYESINERSFLYIFDHDPSCVFLDSQCIQIPHCGKNGKLTSIYPDIFAIFINNEGKLEGFIIDVKMVNALQKLENTEAWQLLPHRSLAAYIIR